MFVLLITLACTAAGPEAPAAVTALTKADIPADLSPELKRAIEKTLSDDNSECVKAMRKLRKLRGGAAPAVPFLDRALPEQTRHRHRGMCYAP